MLWDDKTIQELTLTPNRILYVDDQTDIQIAAEFALETIGGFELLICSSGEEAVSKAEAFAPDILLLDVIMPGMDGPTTLQALRSKTSLSKVPAAFMTAKSSDEELEALYKLDVFGVITKPFDPMVLAEQVRDLFSTVLAE